MFRNGGEEGMPLRLRKNNGARAHPWSLDFGPWHHRRWPCISKPVLPIYRCCASGYCMFALEMSFFAQTLHQSDDNHHNIASCIAFIYNYKTGENRQVLTIKHTHVLITQNTHLYYQSCVLSSGIFSILCCRPSACWT